MAQVDPHWEESMWSEVQEERSQGPPPMTAQIGHPTSVSSQSEARESMMGPGSSRFNASFTRTKTTFSGGKFSSSAGSLPNTTTLHVDEGGQQGIPLSSFPAKTATKLKGLSHSGLVPLSDLEDAATALQRSRSNNRMLLQGMVALLVFMAILVAALGGMTWYIVQSSKDFTVTDQTLTSTYDNTPVRVASADFSVVDNTLVGAEESEACSAGGCEAVRVGLEENSWRVSSLLPDAAFKSLRSMTLHAPDSGAFLHFTVNAFARYPEAGSKHGTVVTLYTSFGEVRVDGPELLFAADASSPFLRAGFDLSPAAGSGARRLLQRARRAVPVGTFRPAVKVLQELLERLQEEEDEAEAQQPPPNITLSESDDDEEEEEEGGVGVACNCSDTGEGGKGKGKGQESEEGEVGWVSGSVGSGVVMGVGQLQRAAALEALRQARDLPQPEAVGVRAQVVAAGVLSGVAQGAKRLLVPSQRTPGWRTLQITHERVRVSGLQLAALIASALDVHAAASATGQPQAPLAPLTPASPSAPPSPAPTAAAQTSNPDDLYEATLQALSELQASLAAGADVTTVSGKVTGLRRTVQGPAATEEEDWRLALDAASALLQDLQALPALHEESVGAYVVGALLRALDYRGGWGGVGLEAQGQAAPDVAALARQALQSGGLGAEWRAGLAGLEGELSALAARADGPSFWREYALRAHALSHAFFTPADVTVSGEWAGATCSAADASCRLDPTCAPEQGVGEGGCGVTLLRLRLHHSPGGSAGGRELVQEVLLSERPSPASPPLSLAHRDPSDPAHNPLATAPPLDFHPEEGREVLAGQVAGLAARLEQAAVDVDGHHLSLSFRQVRQVLPA